MSDHSDTTSSVFTILPPKSHLRLFEDGRWIDGITVVAARDNWFSGTLEVCTERGHWLSLDKDCILVVGR